MSKNTRWALAIVGVVIIIVGAVVIGTGKDNTDAVQKPSGQTTAETGASQSTASTPATGSTGSNSGGNSSGGSGGDDGSGSGGSSPGNSGDNSGGASPDEGGDSGGAQAQTGASGVISPVLSASNVKTVKVDKGETVIIRGRSDSSGEMHVHGYDKEVPLKAGKIARVKIKATIDGEFAIEFHYADGGHADVGTLRVSP